MGPARENLLAELRLTLRPGKRSDAEALRALIGGIRKSYGLPAPVRRHNDDLQDVADWYGSRGGMFDVLEDRSGALVGCCGAYARSRNICVLRRLYMAYRMRHRGLGRLLMEHVLEWARTQGFATVELSIAQVFKEGIQLHERYGFVRRLAESTDGGAACDLRFSLSLRPAPQ